MGSATGFTASRMQVIEDTTVVDGEVIGDNLHLYQRNGTDIDAGNVRGPVGPSAANPVPWSSATAYTTGAIVGYAGVLWKCIANNTNHPPFYFSNEWNPIEGFDYTTGWSAKDPYFNANDFTVAWEAFWKTGTSTPVLTSTAGEFETGYQALKVALAVSSSQTLYQKDENIVRGGEVITVTVRAKLRVASAGNPTVGVGMYQNNLAGPPAPFGTGASVVAAAEANALLTTNWKTYQFTLTAVNAKARAVPYLSIVNGAGAAADVLIDRVEISRNKSVNLQALNVPVGTVVMWPAATIPAGWLPCSGPLVATVSRAAYPELFAVIGTQYGAGDGSTTFNLPNFYGRAPMGLYPGGPYAASLGASGGEASHSLTTAEMPYHEHAQNVLANGAAGSGWRVDYAGDRAFPGTFPQGVNTGGAGTFPNGTAHNVLDPYTTVNFIIRAVPSGGVDKTSVQFFKGAVAANGAVAMAANTNMPFTVRTDPSNAWNATNNNWVCPQPGRYRITIVWRANATAAARAMTIAKNGTVVAKSPTQPNAANAGGTFVEVLDLVPGDTIGARPDTLFTTMADGAGIENTYMIIETVGLEGVATGLSDTGWVNMQLINGWVNYDSGLSIGGAGRACRVRKINGVVYLEGVIKSGAAGSVAFVLPATFRMAPTAIYERSSPVQGNGAITALNMRADTGEVTAGISAYTYTTDQWVAAA